MAATAGVAAAGADMDAAGAALAAGAGLVWARRGAEATTRQSRKREALLATARLGLSRRITLDSLLNRN